MIGIRTALRMSAALLALLLSAPSVADIPRPDRDRDRDGLAERVEIGPIEPLPAIVEPVSREGAGRLPRSVIVETEVTATDPVQRETFLVTQTILDPSRQLRGVEVHRPEGRGIDARALDVSQDTVEIEGRRVNRRHYRWAVQALHGDEVILEFRRIDFEVVGTAQSEFAWVPVARRLSVTPLPPHLPEYLPVSRSLEVHGMEVSELVAGEPGSWRFDVVGVGLSEKAIAQMLQAQLVAPAGLRLDAPAIRRAPDQSAAESTGPLAEAWEVRLSVLPAVSGEGDGSREARLPGLRLPYLDPAADEPGAAIDYARTDAQPVTWQAEPVRQHLDAVRGALPWAAAVLAGLLVLGFVARQGYRRWRSRRDWHQAREYLQTADDPRALRHRLNRVLASLPQPEPSPTRERLERRGAPADWLQARAELDRLRFAGQAADAGRFDELRRELARGLPSRWFR